MVSPPSLPPPALAPLPLLSSLSLPACRVRAALIECPFSPLRASSPRSAAPPRTRAYASASALQVVLWRVRDIMMLQRGARIWVMFLAYMTLLAAVYFGQTVSNRNQ